MTCSVLFNPFARKTESTVFLEDVRTTSFFSCAAVCSYFEVSTISRYIILISIGVMYNVIRGETRGNRGWS